MRVENTATKQFTNEDKWLVARGTECWELLCDEMPLKSPWTVRQAEACVSEYFRCSTRQAGYYIRAVLNNVLAQPEPVSLIKQGIYWSFTDPSD